MLRLTRLRPRLYANVQRKLCVARGELPAELLFKNARLVNVLSGEIHPAHVAVDDGRIVGIGEYDAQRVVDLEGRFLAPSFNRRPFPCGKLDAHRARALPRGGSARHRRDGG